VVVADPAVSDRLSDRAGLTVATQYDQLEAELTRTGGRSEAAPGVPAADTIFAFGGPDTVWGFPVAPDQVTLVDKAGCLWIGSVAVALARLKALPPNAVGGHQVWAAFPERLEPEY
jgi:hypothetical protein